MKKARKIHYPKDLPIVSLRQEIIDAVRELGEECNEKHQNMPENLAYSPTAELLENRGYAMDAWADELDNVEIPEVVEEPEGEEPTPDDFQTGNDAQDDEDYEEAQDAWDEKQSEWQEYEDAKTTALEEFKGCEPEIE